MSSFSYNPVQTREIAYKDRIIGSITVKQEGSIISIISHPVFLSNLGVFNDLLKISTHHFITNCHNLDDSIMHRNGKITIRASTDTGLFYELTFNEDDSLLLANQIISDYIKYELYRTEIIYNKLDSTNPLNGGIFIVRHDSEPIIVLKFDYGSVYFFRSLLHKCSTLNNESTPIKYESDKHKLEYHNKILYVKDILKGTKISIVDNSYLINLAKQISLQY